MKRASRSPCVLLISPGILKWTDMDFGLPHLVSMGGYLLRELGEKTVRVELMDLNYEGADHQTLSNRLGELGPFLCIGLSCYSSFDYMRVLTLGRFLKKLYPDTPLITGGYHASALPSDLIFEGGPFDAVIRGEGELALANVARKLLGGEPLDSPFIDGGVVEELDSLPMYRWDLLNRYWPHAHEIGRKFQIYLSRGCPYRCAFCMERAKSGYQWRAYSPERALAELELLSTYTDLSRWVINLADPLFGLKRSWRRQVLEGMIDRGLTPRQYWTLTRSDDLHEEDVSLLARARFSIGIGMESGSPRMLKIMQKGNQPEAYLQALERLALLSRKHGLNWAANVIIGHPGEDLASMRESFEFVSKLFTSASETCGWLSIDPFRLYPGALIHEEMGRYQSEHGARFYHPEWWKDWYDTSFKAEHIDPSHTLSFEQRVHFMYDHYPELVQQILTRFRGQGRSVDQVFRRSIDSQIELMSPSRRDQLIDNATRAQQSKKDQAHDFSSLSNVPMGLNLKHEHTRRREEVIRHLLEVGALRSQRVIEALLTVAPERYLSADVSKAFLKFPYQSPPLGEASPHPEVTSFYVLALGLEALAPCEGDLMLDALASRGYISALLREAVGREGRVLSLSPSFTGQASAQGGGDHGTFGMLSQLSRWWRGENKRELAQGIQAVQSPQSAQALSRPLQGLQWSDALSEESELKFDGIWLGAALPSAPRALIERLCPPMGRLVTLIGPRFRPQDLVCLSLDEEGKISERILTRSFVPVAVGQGGWVSR